MKMRNTHSVVRLFIAGIFLCLLTVGCSPQKDKLEKINDIEFTVLEEADLPKSLKETIDDKKKEPFKLSYTDQDYLYIARGYGAQKSGGYGISVNDLYLAENAIYFKTELIGPSQEELVTQITTYPYIVVKLESIDKSVVFE